MSGAEVVIAAAIGAAAYYTVCGESVAGVGGTTYYTGGLITAAYGMLVYYIMAFKGVPAAGAEIPRY